MLAAAAAVAAASIIAAAAARAVATPNAASPDGFSQDAASTSNVEQTAEDRLSSEARDLACQMRERFGQTVDPKGENAIKALLLMRDHPSIKQKDAQEKYVCSKWAIQKYRKLLGQLHAESATRLPLGLLTADWLLEHTHITGWCVVAVESLADRTSKRTFRATLVLSTGVIERDVPVVFDPSASAMQSNWKREAAAAQALANEWHELCGDQAPSSGSISAQHSVVNILRASYSSCDIRSGEWVWIPQSPTASYLQPVASVNATPELARVNHCFANGALEVTLFNTETLAFDEANVRTLPPCSSRFEMQHQAMRLQSFRPLYVGEVAVLPQAVLPQAVLPGCLLQARF